MRNLTAEEWVVVSGGHPSEQDGGLQEVVVNGQRHQYRDPFSGVPWILFAQYWAHSSHGMRPAGYYEDQGGGDSDDEEQETPRDTPCVTAKPTEHGNILDLHKGAIDLKIKAYEKYGAADWEHVGFVWKMPGGDVRTTDAFTSFDRNEITAETVWAAINEIPDGAIILGLFTRNRIAVR